MSVSRRNVVKGVAATIGAAELGFFPGDVLAKEPKAATDGLGSL